MTDQIIFKEKSAPQRYTTLNPCRNTFIDEVQSPLSSSSIFPMDEQHKPIIKNSDLYFNYDPVKFKYIINVLEEHTSLIDSKKILNLNHEYCFDTLIEIKNFYPSILEKITILNNTTTSKFTIQNVDEENIKRRMSLYS
jgi:hypothetical protein